MSESQEPLRPSQDQVPPVENMQGQSLGNSTELQPSQKQTEQRQEWKKKEEVNKNRDEQIAKRNLEYPDLQEALKILHPQLGVVKGFLDGTLHQQRAGQAQNRIVMIPELRRQLDELNNQIGDLRTGRGMQFRASDVWAAFNNMPLVPDAIALRPPHVSEDIRSQYVDHHTPDGALYGAQSLHIQIDANGFSLINQQIQRIPNPLTSGVDTLLFTMQQHGGLRNGNVAGIDAAQTLTTREMTTEYLLQSVVQRFRSYGIRVAVLHEGEHMSIYVDLQSRLPRNNDRYLVITPGGLGGDRWELDRSRTFMSNYTPPAAARFE